MDAVQLITNTTIAARLWAIAFVAAILLCLATPYLTIMAMKEKEKVIVLGGDGTILFTESSTFAQAGELHAYHARLACLAFLQRNPNGEDIPDLLNRIFLEDSERNVREFIRTQSEEFHSKKIHQKVEITSLQILDTRKMDSSTGETFDVVIVDVKGQLIRNGILEGKAFCEPARFQTEFTFIRNPDLVNSKMLPLVVFDFKHREEAI